MTIASETSRVDLVGDGENDTFTFTFEIYVKTDLLVYADGELQAVDVNYTVADEAIENPDGGDIVFGEDYIPALDAVVSIILNLPYTQLIDYVEADKFPAETHERGLDRLIKIAQQHKEKLSRTPSLAISSALSDLIIPEAASRAIGWDSLGEELTTYPITPVLDANWDSIQNYGNDLAVAVATIGAGAKTLLIDVSTESVIANLEVPETLELYPTRTGLITVDNCILTINRLSEAVGPHKIFNCINGGTIVFGSGPVKEASPQWWGIVTGVDSTASFQAAVDSLTIGNVFFPYRADGYEVASTTMVPAAISLIGNFARIIPIAGGSFTSNYVFMLNTTDGVTWDYPYPAIYNCNVKGFFIDNSVNEIVSLKGWIFAGGYHFEDYRTDYLWQAIVGTADYNEPVTIHRGFSRQSQGSDYPITLNQLGDGTKVDSIHFTGTNNKGVYIGGCGGGEIANCIGGDMKIMRSRAFTIRNWHSELDQIIVDSSDLTIEDSILYKGDNIPIVLELTDTDNWHVLTLKNVVFAHWMDVVSESYTEYDLKTHAGYFINIENCTKKTTRLGGISISEHGGILLENEADSDFSAFNKCSHFFSRKCHIETYEIIEQGFEANVGSGAVDIMPPAYVATSSYLTWEEASDTYYYKSQLILEPDAMIGINASSAESSIALTSEGDGMTALINLRTNGGRNAIFRLYRGTATGSYDKYVDIPMVAVRRIYDDGIYVNGYPWQARGAADIDDINVNVNGFIRKSGLLEVVAAAAPTYGTWAVGDRVYDSTPAGGATPGWICVTAGTPGTWKAMANLAA